MAQVELAHKKWAKSDKNWRSGDQNKVRLSKKVKPHRARILFWKIGKNVSKMVRYAQFFWYYP